jgi:hypothetical protein
MPGLMPDIVLCWAQRIFDRDCRVKPGIDAQG